MTSVEATVLREGLDFGEAPRWRDGRLWFSDFYRHAVFTLDEDGAEERVLDVPEQPSGLGWLPDGRLLVVSMRDRRVLRREADGSLVQHADLSRFATFHANDLLVDERGRAYVGNFGFDLHGALASRSVEEVLGDESAGATTLVRVDPDGAVHPVDGGRLLPERDGAPRRRPHAGARRDPAAAADGL